MPRLVRRARLRGGELHAAAVLRDEVAVAAAFAVHDEHLRPAADAAAVAAHRLELGPEGSVAAAVFDRG